MNLCAQKLYNNINTKWAWKPDCISSFTLKRICQRRLTSSVKKLIDFNALLIPSPCMRATEMNCNNTKLRFKLWKFVFFFLWVCIKILFILMIYICDSSLIRLLLKYLISGSSPSFLLLLFSFLNYSLRAFYTTL